MDIKLEIKEEPSLPDFVSHNDCEFSLRDIENKVKSEIDVETEFETVILASDFCCQNEGEFISDDREVTFNKSNETDTKIEIKQEQVTSTETLCIYNEIKDETDNSFAQSVRLYEGGASSYKSGLLCNENIRKDSLECERARKCQTEEGDVKYVSSTESMICSKNALVRKSDLLTSCLETNNFIEQSMTQGIDNEHRKTYRCGTCGRCFSNSSGLKKHKLAHEGIKPHKCGNCDKAFTHLSSLKSHQMIHKPKEALRCDICDKDFNCLSRLKRHNLIHEGTKAHTCDICQKAFRHLSSLKTHQMIHDAIRPYECNVCHKMFTRSSTLKVHHLIHEGKKPYQCDICKKCFNRLSHMKSHKLVHDDTKLHKCGVCEKGFNRLYRLKSHELIHEGIKPYKCDICDRGFSDLSVLKKHKLTHEGKKPHKCDICEKAFKRLSDLKRHKIIHKCHTGLVENS